MRILFIAGNVNQIGGIEKYNRTLVTTLKEAGVELVLVEREPGGLGAKIIFAIRVLASAIFQHPDFIICAHLHFSPLCSYLKKLFGIPYSVSVYGEEVINIKTKKRRKGLESAEKIIYLFGAAKEDVLRQIPGAEEKMFQLPNSVDGERFKILEKSKELLFRYDLTGSRVILTICRMYRLDGDNKGYRRVIKAMPRVLEVVPDAKYLLVGKGDDIPGIRQLITELGLRGKVILADAPTNERIADYYNLADAFILPSKNEGFPPIVILEALACGVPVIGGNQRGAEEAMLSGELGLIVPAEDIGAISDAIVKILKKNANPGFFDREALRAKALEIYGPENYTKRIRRFLNLIKK